MTNFKEKLNTVAKNYENFTNGCGLYEAISNVNRSTITLLFNNFPAILETFKKSIIKPIKDTDERKTFGFAHFLTKEPDVNADPYQGWYATSAFRLQRNVDGTMEKYVRIRSELVDIWNHGGHVPGLFIFSKQIDGTYKYLCMPSDKVKSYIANKNIFYRNNDGYTFIDIKIDEEPTLNVPEYYDEKNTTYKVEYIPSFLKIAKCSYSKFKSSGRKVVITAYSIDGLNRDSFTYRSLNEAACVLQKLGVNISAKTVARHYKSKKPILNEACNQYDLYYIADEEGPMDVGSFKTISKTIVNDFTGEKAEKKVIDTKVHKENVDDIVTIVDIDEEEKVSDESLQNTIIEEYWDTAPVYRNIHEEWLIWRKVNPGKSYDYFLKNRLKC